MTAIKLRTQNDGLNEKVSLESAIAFPAEENQTRSEFAADSDINNLLGRYGALPAGGRPLTYGVVNFDDDLTTAYEAIDRAKAAFDTLPAEVKKLYPDWQTLAREIARGDANPALGKDLETQVKSVEEAARQAAKNPPAPTEVPSGGDGGSTSEARQK